VGTTNPPPISRWGIQVEAGGWRSGKERRVEAGDDGGEVRGLVGGVVVEVGDAPVGEGEVVAAGAAAHPDAVTDVSVAATGDAVSAEDGSGGVLLFVVGDESGLVPDEGSSEDDVLSSDVVSHGVLLC
jgi:hypothetical protein